MKSIFHLSYFLVYEKKDEILSHLCSHYDWLNLKKALFKTQNFSARADTKQKKEKGGAGGEEEGW